MLGFACGRRHAARSRLCAAFYDDFTTELARLDAQTRNALANPFACAYLDQEWGEIVDDECFSFGKCIVFPQCGDSPSGSMLQPEAPGLYRVHRCILKSLTEHQEYR